MEEAKQMPIELNKGEFYIMQGDKCISLGEGVAETEFIESEDEAAPITHNWNSSVEFSSDIIDINQEWLNDLIGFSEAANSFTIDYDMSIMIQARWHKKTRIRKKWLKRFGMKPDTVKVSANMHMLEYCPGHILAEQYDNNGVCATFNSFGFEIDKQEYILRPDQKRKGLKIEW